MTEPKKKPVTTQELKRQFLNTVQACENDPKLTTACHFIYDKNLKV